MSEFESGGKQPTPEQIRIAELEQQLEIAESRALRAEVRFGYANAALQAEKMRREIAERQNLRDQQTGLLNERGLEAVYIRLAQARPARRESDPQKGTLQHSMIFGSFDPFGELDISNGRDDVFELHGILGQIISKESRKEDWVGKCGRDQYIIILEDTPIERAIVLAERIREKASEIYWPPDAPDNQKLAVTMSLGVSSLDLNVPIFAHIAVWIDNAISDIQGQGTNRVVIFGNKER